METAIVVPLPELAPAVDGIRRLHTRAGAEGMPPHVTLLIPFVDSEELRPEVVERAANAIAGFPAFVTTLAELRYFDDQDAVLYLAPEPAETFCSLIAALTNAFPDYPPYRGAHPEPVPHVTVAVGDRTFLRTLEDEVAPRLPVATFVDHAVLLARDTHARWRPQERLPLAVEPHHRARASAADAAPRRC